MHAKFRWQIDSKNIHDSRVDRASLAASTLRLRTRTQTAQNLRKQMIQFERDNVPDLDLKYTPPPCTIHCPRRQIKMSTEAEWIQELSDRSMLVSKIGSQLSFCPHTTIRNLYILKPINFYLALTDFNVKTKYSRVRYTQWIEPPHRCISPCDNY